jgi:hypothetical protein
VASVDATKHLAWDVQAFMRRKSTAAYLRHGIFPVEALIEIREPHSFSLINNCVFTVHYARGERSFLTAPEEPDASEPVEAGLELVQFQRPTIKCGSVAYSMCWQAERTIIQ